MHRLVTGVWFVQGLALLVLCLAILLRPELVAGIEPDQVPTDGLVLLIAGLQMTAAPLAAMAFASILGAMRNDRLARRRFAKAMVVGFGGYLLLGLALQPEHIGAMPGPVADAHTWLHDRLGERLEIPHLERLEDLTFVTGRPIIIWPLTVMFAFAVLAAVWPVGDRPVRMLSGRADSKPEFLWAAWVVQGLCMFGYAAFLFWFGHALLDPQSALFVVEDARPYLPPASNVEPLNEELRDAASFLMFRSSALWFAVGMLVWAGIHETNDTEWRGFRNIHMLWLGGWIVTIGLAWDGAVFSWVVLLPAVLALLWFQVNRKAVPPRGDFPPEEAADPPDGWTLIDMISGPLIALRVLFGKRRGTHAHGVAATGNWHPAGRDPNAPPHDYFFRPAWPDSVEVTMRFANVTFKDDAGMDVRGAALRIQAPGEAPLDLLMNTGSCGPIENVAQFALLVASKAFPRFMVVKAVKKNRKGREGGISGLRRAPSSYSHLHYYSQSTRYWLTPSDERLLVRYRIIPADPDVIESGLPDYHDRVRSWERERRADETRPHDYLRRELRQRLETSKVRMKLQAQFHRPSPGDTLAWYNGMYDWPPEDHPWFDLGVAELDEGLPDAQAERLRFSPVNHPPSLGVPVAVDWFDPRSPADSERRIIERTAALRSAMYRMFGMPRDEGADA